MVHSEVNDTELVLVSARKSRGAEHWDKDDHDVTLGDGRGPVVGRIMRHPQAPETQPWFWTIRNTPDGIKIEMPRQAAAPSSPGHQRRG
jgi:hypothetical protein